MDMDQEIIDEELMLRYRDGDADAFEALYSRHKDPLYRHIRRQCPDPEIAFDLVHDIWLKVIKARRRYRAEARFTTYLYTLARNRMVDYYRAQSAKSRAAPREEEPLEMDELPDEVNDGTDTRAHILDVVEHSLELIQTLPQMQRESVLMYAEGFSMVEIAEITQVPPETARSRVRHALAKIRLGLRDLIR